VEGGHGQPRASRSGLDVAVLDVDVAEVAVLAVATLRAVGAEREHPEGGGARARGLVLVLVAPGVERDVVPVQVAEAVLVLLDQY
jgi:hypothetical protein